MGIFGFCPGAAGRLRRYGRPDGAGPSNGPFRGVARQSDQPADLHCREYVQGLFAHRKQGDSGTCGTDMADVQHAGNCRQRSVPPCGYGVAAAPVEVHGVTAAEVSKQPAILYLYTGRPEYLAAVDGFYASVERDHELVDGIPTSCEKLLGKAPEALHETCDISDFMWSYGYMLMATGDVRWADKLENAFYNAALGAVSKDFRAHQYFSSPNQIVATQFSSAADYGEEGLLRQAYRSGFDTECCSGNVHRMFPNYVSRMWLRDSRGGIVAALYAPGRLSTQVEDCSVAVLERTDYPFGAMSNLSSNAPKL